jgi:O-antigen biosynthesis protein
MIPAMDRVCYGERFSAGWYSLAGRLPASATTDDGWWLCAVAADSPDLRLPISPPDVVGNLRGVVMLPSELSDVHLEDDSGSSVVVAGSLQLRPISRFSACVRMLWDLGRIDFGLMLGTALRMLGFLASGRPTRGGDLVFSRYLGTRHGRVVAAGVACGVQAGLRAQSGVEFQPIDQLDAHADGRGGWEWETTGDDPKFRLVRSGVPARLHAGWYFMRAVFRLHAGHVIAPCLYPDYGAGWSFETCVVLPEPDPDGALHSLVLFKHDVRDLRFDPTQRQARFALDGVELVRVSRLRALLHMLSSRRYGDAVVDWRTAGSSILQFARVAARRGVSAAGASLFQEYTEHQRRGASGYDAWVRRYDTITAADRQMLEVLAQRQQAGPLISVLLPVYETSEQWLRRCLDSVLQQAYGNWELCIADDASPSPHVRRVLEEYARRDARVRVSWRSSNGHISEASNTALEMARGDYVGMLDHDDELRPHALLEMVEAISKDPVRQLLYSDEDKIDAAGRRFDPYFKPDWNPDLLLSQNYVCHFTVIRTSLAREAGGFRAGYEGSQDHDLILRCTERLRSDQIHHVPKVLYHWRAIKGSTALERHAKDYAGAAGVRAVADHLERKGTGATAEQLQHGHYRVRWPVPDPAPLVSLIVPTRDRVELLRSCVESILDRTTYENIEVVVVDNQSTETRALDYLQEIAKQHRVTVLRFDRPFNYSAINNWAVARCRGDVIGLVNNDIEVISPGWLEEMVGLAIRPDVGAVGAKLYYPDGSIQHAGVILGLGGVANHAYVGQPSGYPGHGGRALVAQNLSAVTGACLVVRRALYEELHGLEERLGVAFNDVDFCLRLRERGYRNVWTPFAEMYHHESASRGRDESAEKRARFLAEIHYMESRWGDTLRNDPAYNPNLSLESMHSELAFPPRCGRDPRQDAPGEPPASTIVRLH